MPPGKLAAQAGHAFVDSIHRARERDPTRVEEYQSEGHGTKVVLEATLEELLLAHELAVQAGLSSALVVDAGHVLPPHFTGAPIVTALGIGPALRHEVQHITRRFPLVR